MRKSYLVSLLTLSSLAGNAQTSPNEQWATTFNANVDQLSQHYLKNAIIISERGQLLEDQVAIENYYRELKKEIGEIERIETIGKAEVNTSLSYEIGYFKSRSGEMYNHLIIWKAADSPSRELEVIAKQSANKGNLEEINQARTQWIELCNKHDPYTLVSTMYTPDAIYYNHKPVVTGTDEIATTYAYMKRPAYQLSLSPIYVEAVNEETVFEIGQCSGSYGGKYLLVWRKKDGEWKVLLDSNL